jgi:xanthine dehydrogenase accessory factor
LFPSGTQFCEVDRSYSGKFLKSFGHRDLYVTIVSRCWETDKAALLGIAKQAPKNLRYLGLMGSQRKIDRVTGERRQDEVDLDGLNLQAPIGLSIGAETPSEIAVSILAQIIQTRGAVGGRVSTSSD